MRRAVVRLLAEVAAVPVARARATTIQVLLSPAEGGERLATRLFTVAPGGRIPCHRHSLAEHQQVVLAGGLVLGVDGLEHEVAAGECVLLPAGTAHWYDNRGAEPARFLCMVPVAPDDVVEWLEPPLSD